MTQEIKHTPLPWVMDEKRTQSGLTYHIGSREMLVAGKGCCIIYDDYLPYVLERKANADFIIQACNSHYELLDALESLFNLDIKGHSFAGRLQFSDAGRALVVKIVSAINKAKGS